MTRLFASIALGKRGLKGGLKGDPTSQFELIAKIDKLQRLVKISRSQLGHQLL
jgi:hypothetical protein